MIRAGCQTGPPTPLQSSRTGRHFFARLPIPFLKKPAVCAGPGIFIDARRYSHCTVACRVTVGIGGMLVHGLWFFDW
jgi:hypothetical protein